jgi:hypothetical protein
MRSTANHGGDYSSDLAPDERDIDRAATAKMRILPSLTVS